MLNYLGAQFFHRFYLSSETRIALSSRTLTMLRSITNQMVITLYYDTRRRRFFPGYALAGRYHSANRNIVVRTVDYEEIPVRRKK